MGGGFLEALVSLVCFTRWSVPMDFLAYLHRFPQNTTKMDIIIKAQHDMYLEFYTQSHWKLYDGEDEYWWTGLLALLLMGTSLRAAAFLGLVFVNRGKQV